MKKLLAMLLASLMITSLVACGTKDTTPTLAENTGDTANTESTAWTPDRQIELVACYGAGGGHNILLRTMQKIIVDEKLSDATFNVVNKDGGSGAAGMAYVNGHKGDPHYLMCTTSSFTTTPLKTKLGFNYNDFTPIALPSLCSVLTPPSSLSAPTPALRIWMVCLQLPRFPLAAPASAPSTTSSL